MMQQLVAVLCEFGNRLLQRDEARGGNFAQDAAAFYQQILRIWLHAQLSGLAHEQNLTFPATLFPTIADCTWSDSSLPVSFTSLDPLLDAYQALLSLHPMVNPVNGQFELIEAPGHLRQREGSYYTPPALVACLLDTALNPVLDRCNHTSDPLKALLSLRICDPACGSGQLLCAAAARLASRITDRLKTNGSTPVSIHALAVACLHGVDLNPISVELCRSVLWLAGKGQIPLPSLTRNICWGNSLVGVGPNQAVSLRMAPANDLHPFDWAAHFPEKFDVVLCNPPWGRIKLHDRKWFAHKSPEIAQAPEAKTRLTLRHSLASTNPALTIAWQDDQRRLDAERRFCLHSGRFPLAARGDLNRYSLFVELSQQLLRPQGRAGLIVPSGIATDDTMSELFQWLVKSRLLAHLYDFHNRKQLFVGVQGNVKFSLLTLTNEGSPSFRVAAQLEHPDQLVEPGRIYELGRINWPVSIPTMACSQRWPRPEMPRYLCVSMNVFRLCKSPGRPRIIPGSCASGRCFT